MQVVDDIQRDTGALTAKAGRRVGMVTSSFYESDNRVMRYAQALAERGDAVDVFALRRSPDLPETELIDGVNVFRIQARYGKNEKTKSSFLWPLLRFLAVSSWQLLKRSRQLPYDVVHVHNIPDFMVFAAWYPKLTGTRVILDIHDIVPELFASKFGGNKNAGIVRALQVVEKLSAAFADHVIIANHLWWEKYIARSAPAKKCSVFINHVDERVFKPGRRESAKDTPTVLFPGGLQWHQGVDLAIRAFAILRRRIPDAEFHIYGDGSVKNELIALARELEVDGSVRFFAPLRLHEIAEVMANATLGVVPKRADTFGNEAYSTKIMEFMAVRVPVVVSETRVDRFYFDDSVVRFFESGNVESLAKAMIDVLMNPSDREQMVNRAAEYSGRNSWAHRKASYLNLVDSLCNCSQPNLTVCASTAV